MCFTISHGLTSHSTYGGTHNILKFGGRLNSHGVILEKSRWSSRIPQKKKVFLSNLISPLYIDLGSGKHWFMSLLSFLSFLLSLFSFPSFIPFFPLDSLASCSICVPFLSLPYSLIMDLWARLGSSYKLGGYYPFQLPRNYDGGLAQQE